MKDQTSTSNPNFKHGGCTKDATGRQTRLYNIWNSLKQRCCNPDCKSYPRYGGRGITITCQDWFEFPKFRKWALANGYAENLSLDRIDNNGNYCPANCQWITIRANTKKQALKVTREDGVEFSSVAEAAGFMGCHVQGIYAACYGRSKCRGFKFTLQYIQ